MKKGTSHWTKEPETDGGAPSFFGFVTLALPSNDHGGSDVTLVSSNPALSVPASVKVSPNATTSTFTIATSAVTAPVPLVVTATYGGVTQRMNASTLYCAGTYVGSFVCMSMTEA